MPEGCDKARHSFSAPAPQSLRGQVLHLRILRLIKGAFLMKKITLSLSRNDFLSADRPTKLRAVADTIEHNRKHFDMTNFFHNCGTPACVAGFTIALASLKTFKDNQSATEAAAETLDLTLQQALDLLHPDGTSFSYVSDAKPGKPGHITWKHAVRTLRHFADTGVVDWDATAK